MATNPADPVDDDGVGPGDPIVADPILADPILADPHRLAALHRTGLLDTAPAPGLDRLTRLASRLLGTPIAMVSLVDHDRQFFASQVGLDGPAAVDRATPLSLSFCRHVVTSGQPVVISDANLSPSVRDNPAITELGFVAYAGMPLLSNGGLVLGSFCAIDRKPREWSDADLDLLADLAALAGSEMQLRSAVRTSQSATGRLDVLAEASGVLSSSLKVDATLDQLARLLVPRLADLCTIDVVDDADTGDVRLAAIAAFDPGLAAAEPVGPRHVDPAGITARVLGSAEPLLMTGLDNEEGSDEQTRRYRRFGLRSGVVVPLIARGEVLGALTLLSTEARRYGSEDLVLVADLGRRAGLALDNSRLFAAEHEVAVALQRSLLPRLPKVAGLRLAARYLVSAGGAAVGGDWYDVLALSDGATGLAIGDVMGHDIHAAAAMGQLRSVLRSYAWESVSPALVLDRMDRLVQGLGMADLATAIYARLEPSTGPAAPLAAGPTGPVPAATSDRPPERPSGTMTLRWANAGHLPPIVLTPDGRAHLLEGGRSVLLGAGFGRHTQPRTEGSAELVPGSTVVLYTDGVIDDRHHDVDHAVAALVRVVARHDRREGPDVLCERILAVNPDADDDIAILVVQLAESTP